ncbi:helix-turn-helix domain-containing protein [Streptomyces globisporus]|uniref:helix-turn-helix domain-containing protein n=1 Tax=Streptomyces globisporus TaxID=1908 RepID=UPI0038113728
MVFVDRLLATLVHLRHGVTHDVLACWFGVDRSTVTRGIGEVRQPRQRAPLRRPRHLLRVRRDPGRLGLRLRRRPASRCGLRPAGSDPGEALVRPELHR